VTQERHVHNAVKDAVFGRLKRAKPGPDKCDLEPWPHQRPACQAHARRGGEGRAARTLSGTLCADRSLEDHGDDKIAMLRAEKTSFANLMVTPTAQNLIRVFLPARADEETRG